jgi:hypothetical protein
MALPEYWRGWRQPDIEHCIDKTGTRVFLSGTASVLPQLRLVFHSIDNSQHLLLNERGLVSASEVDLDNSVGRPVGRDWLPLMFFGQLSRIYLD